MRMMMNMSWKTETHLNILKMYLWIVSNLETENSFKPIVFIQWIVHFD